MPTPTYEAVLSRVDGGKDVVILRYPTIPDRLRLHSTYRYAMGYRDGVVARDDSLYANEDVIACAAAAVGLGWTGAPLPDLETFRAMGRDVVAYGESVISALYLAGYIEPEEVVSAGLTFHAEYMKAFFEAHAGAKANFPKASPKTP